MKRALFLLMVLAALVRSLGIDRPWSQGDHNGWGGAFYSNIARNYLRYGYWETRAAPVISTGKTPPEQRRFYLTHPPLIGIAVSLSFRLFGEHEWSARLVPLAFSVGSVLLVYLLGSNLASRHTGIVAAAIFSFVPAEVVYGAHVDPQGPPVTFFSLLLLLAYEKERPLLAAGALVLGAGFDWPIHYLAGLLSVDAFLYRPDRRRWAIGLLLGSLLLAGGMFLYARLVAPSTQQQYLESRATDALLFWSGLRVDPRRIPGRSIRAPAPREWLTRVGAYFHSLFTLPLLVLAAFGTAVVGVRGRGGHLWIVLSWGLLHILLFPLGAFVHDYWSVYLAPGLALAAASGLESIAKRLKNRQGLFLVGSTTALSVFLVASGIHSVDSIPREPVTLGKELHQFTTPDEGILALYPIDARDAYYADRVFRDQVNRVSLFEEALRDRVHYRYFLVPKRVFHERPRKPLFRMLRTCCPFYRFEEFYLFDLSPLSTGLEPEPDEDQEVSTGTVF